MESTLLRDWCEAAFTLFSSWQPSTHPHHSQEVERIPFSWLSRSKWGWWRVTSGQWLPSLGFGDSLLGNVAPGHLVPGHRLCERTVRAGEGVIRGHDLWVGPPVTGPRPSSSQRSFLGAHTHTRPEPCSCRAAGMSGRGQSFVTITAISSTTILWSHCSLAVIPSASFRITVKEFREFPLCWAPLTQGMPALCMHRLDPGKGAGGKPLLFVPLSSSGEQGREGTPLS